MTAQKPEGSNANYNYTAPTTSPFYDGFLSPLCNWVVYNLVPTWVHPDQLTVAGVVCAAAAAYCAMQESQYMFFIVGLLWMLYSIFDNLDGKQARRLKASSSGGEFLDHSCDACVVTLSFYVWSLALLGPDRLAAWRPVLVVFAAQLPFYVGSWGHHLIGRLILGSSVNGRDYFTVDEFNFLFVPSLCFLRALFGSMLWDASMDWLVRDTLHVPVSWVEGVTGDAEGRGVTVGIVLVFMMFVFCTIASIKVISQILNSVKAAFLLTPMIAHMLVSLALQADGLTMLAPFAAINMELIGGRLGVHGSNPTHGWLFWPPVVLLLAAIRAPMGSTHHCCVNYGLWAALAVIMNGYKLTLRAAGAKAASVLPTHDSKPCVPQESRGN
eukprot:GDKI01033117.1.p1 GENE.GDKI01033117.1~~GDKI01033117.1.p1  ORF type:complete len:383 (-),score=79.53 GDKI01033117.1:167-1315(-)